MIEAVQLPCNSNFSFLRIKKVTEPKSCYIVNKCNKTFQFQTLCLGGKKDILDIVSNHSEQSATTYDPNSEETTNNECDDYDEDNFETALESFEAYTSKFI